MSRSLILDPEISTCLKMPTFWYMSSRTVVRTKDQASDLQKSCSILQKSSFKNFSNIEHIRLSIFQGVEIILVKSKKLKSVILGKSCIGIMAPRVGASFGNMQMQTFWGIIYLRLRVEGLYRIVYFTPISKQKAFSASWGLPGERMLPSFSLYVPEKCFKMKF